MALSKKTAIAIAGSEINQMPYILRIINFFATGNDFMTGCYLLNFSLLIFTICRDYIY